MTFNCSVAHVSPQYSKISQFPMLLSGTVNLSLIQLIVGGSDNIPKMHLKGGDVYFFASLLPLFLPHGRTVDTTVGAPATILDHEVIMRMETVSGRETRQRKPGTLPLCSSRSTLSFLVPDLRNFPLCYFCVSYPSSQKLILTKTGWLSTISR